MKKQIDSAREMGVRGVVTLAACCLFLGHAVTGAYFSGQIPMLTGFFLIWSLLFWILCIQGDELGFLLIILLCSHFVFLDERGGLWNLLTTAVVPIYFLGFRRAGANLPRDRLPNVLLGAFLVLNVLSWIFVNRMPVMLRGWGAAGFLGQLLIFVLARRIRLTPQRLRKVFLVLGTGVGLNFLVTANQHFGLLDLRTPLLGGNPFSPTSPVAMGYALGTFHNSETSAQQSLMAMLLFIPLVGTRQTRAALNIGFLTALTGIAIAAICMFMAVSRSAFLLACLFTVCYFVFFSTTRQAVVDSRASFYSYGVMLTGIILVSGIYLGLDALMEKFERLKGVEISIRGIVTGESINRGETTKAAVARLKSGSWWLGHGAGTQESNQIVFFGKATTPTGKPLKRYLLDFHSLYLELPLLYGWVGGAAFLLLFLLALKRLAGALRRYRRESRCALTFCVGLLFMWSAFLMNQYKISIFRNMGVQMITWTLLGLTYAALATLKADVAEEKALAGKAES